MLWQLVDFPTLTSQPSTRAWRRRLAVARVVEAATSAVRLASGVRARLRKESPYFEPDPYATEASFLSDRWPGQ